MPGRGGAVRPEVAASWERSAAAGVPADRVAAPLTLATPDLVGRREAHPLARVLPLLDDVLGECVRACDAVLAVTDAEGTLLWLSGASPARTRAEAIGFVEGSNWDERLAGTNAPGLALATGRSHTVTRTEHYRNSVHGWSCAATPIHDPATTELLGVLDVTGGDQVVVPQTLAMVRTAARLAEAELARERLASAPTSDGPRTSGGLRVVLSALGREEALVDVESSGGRRTTLRLSRRHSEILVLLAAAPQGLSGDELGVLLYREDGGSSTLRAELNRLRGLLGEDLLASRPYRLAAGVAGDWWAVDALLSAGDVRGAMRAYRGPLLRRSHAPGVIDLRERLEARLRHAVLHSGQADLLSSWTRSPWGGDDYEAWTVQRGLTPPGSPLRPLVEGQIARLDRELGATSPQRRRS